MSHAAPGHPTDPYMLGRSQDAESREGDPYAVGHGSESTATGHGSGGPAPKRIVVGYGFWIFLISDIIMFSAFFAAFAVLRGATDGGPTGRELFDIPFVAVETGLLLASSFACGMAGIALAERNALLFQVTMAVTFLFGAGFLAMESTSSATWCRSAPVRRARPSCRPSSPWSAATACTSSPAACGSSP